VEPGKVVLFGSGETSSSGQKVFDHLFRSVPPPIKVSILETPAGFELNSRWVAGQVEEFLLKRLKNYGPHVEVIPARKRNTAFSPDDPELIKPLLHSNVIYMGAGSPTYAVHQLQDSLAWHMLIARHRMGSALVFASASTLTVSAYTLPVYEIYKVGEELHWEAGLDLFGSYGLSLVFLPHWNNNDGGANLDTSRCFMGLPRFVQLLEKLPHSVTLIGIEEHTGIILDLKQVACQSLGRGAVIVIRDGKEYRHNKGEPFSLHELGPFHMPEIMTGIPSDVLKSVQSAEEGINQRKLPQPSEDVYQLVAERELAREGHDWVLADRLRDRIGRLGWRIQDTPEGTQLFPLDD
jgi:cyanophycinase-like exopeptidase